MAAVVPHFRPDFDTGGLKSGLPVSARDWGHLASLGNFCNGHGGMLIPWTSLNFDQKSAGANVYHFYVGPKNRAVLRRWRVNLRSTGGTTAAVTCGSASAVTVHSIASVTGRTSAYEFVEPLAAKTNTAGDTTLSIDADDVLIESVAMYEETRAWLAMDTTDYGVDVTSVRVRQPIADIANRAVRGASDAYKNLDARRAGVFHWSTPTTNALGVTAGALTDIFPLYPPALAAVVGTGTTTSTFTCAVYAKVDAGAGDVTFSSTQAGGTVTLAPNTTSFAWYTGSLTINAEDLTATDGRQSSAWETIRIRAQKATATQMDVAAISVLRTTAPL